MSVINKDLSISGSSADSKQVILKVCVSDGNKAKSAVDKIINTIGLDRLKQAVLVEVNRADVCDIMELRESQQAGIEYVSKTNFGSPSLLSLKRFSQFVVDVKESELLALLDAKVIEIEENTPISEILEKVENARSLAENTPLSDLSCDAVMKIKQFMFDQIEQIFSQISGSTRPLQKKWLIDLLGELRKYLLLLDNIKEKGALVLQVGKVMAILDELSKEGDDHLFRDVSQYELLDLLLAEFKALKGADSASSSNLFSPRGKNHTYIIQVPMGFKDEASALAKINEIINRFPSLSSSQGRKLKFIFGLNLPEDASSEKKVEMARFIEQHSDSFNLTKIVSFLWSRPPGNCLSSPSNNNRRINYVGIRNQLMEQSMTLIEQAVHDAKNTALSVVSLVTIDPDTQICENLLHKAELFWKDNQPLVTAACYKYKIPTPPFFVNENNETSIDGWSSLLVEIANDHDTEIKKAIAAKTYLDYELLKLDRGPDRIAAQIAKNLICLEEFIEGLDYRKEVLKSSHFYTNSEQDSSRNRAIIEQLSNRNDAIKSLGQLRLDAEKLLAAYKKGQPQLISLLEKGFSKTPTSLLQILNKKISGDTILYPNEAFLVFSIYQKTMKSLSEHFQSNFWGKNGESSESQIAINNLTKKTKSLSLTPLKFMPDEHYISDTPNRHLDVASGIVSSNMHLLRNSFSKGSLESRAISVVTDVLTKMSQGSLQKQFYTQRESYILGNRGTIARTLTDDLSREVLLAQMAGHLGKLQKEHLNSALDDVNAKIKEFASQPNAILPIPPDVIHKGRKFKRASKSTISTQNDYLNPPRIERHKVMAERTLDAYESKTSYSSGPASPLIFPKIKRNLNFTLQNSPSTHQNNGSRLSSGRPKPLFSEGGWMTPSVKEPSVPFPKPPSVGSPKPARSHIYSQSHGAGVGSPLSPPIIPSRTSSLGSPVVSPGSPQGTWVTVSKKPNRFLKNI